MSGYSLKVLRFACSNSRLFSLAAILLFWHLSARGQNVILRVLCAHKTILEKRDNLVKIRLERSCKKNFEKNCNLSERNEKKIPKVNFFIWVGVIKTLKNIPKIYGGFENFIEFDCWMPTFFSMKSLKI